MSYFIYYLMRVYSFLIPPTAGGDPRHDFGKFTRIRPIADLCLSATLLVLVAVVVSDCTRVAVVVRNSFRIEV